MNDQHPDPHTPTTDVWEDAMSRGLDDRVRDLHEAPLSLADVQGTARTIQRKRRLAVAGAVLATAAVITPVAVLSSNALRTDGDTVPPATAPASPSQGVDGNTDGPDEPAPGSLGVAYLEGTTLHRADGSTAELDQAYDGGTTVGSTFLGVRNDEGRLTIDVVAGDGLVVDSVDAWSYPVANADHTVAAYVTRDGGLAFQSVDGGMGYSAELRDGDRVVAVTGGPGCADALEGCAAYVAHGDGSPTDVVEDGRSTPLPGTIKVSDVSVDGLVAAQTSSTDTGSCSAVLDRSGAGDPTPVFETCDATLFDFSPDGAHINGSHAYLDGIGRGYVTILDAARGTEVARFTPDGIGFVHDTVWQDADHLLVDAYEAGEWRIYRLGVDGSQERVLASSTGDEGTPAFTLLDGS